MEDRIARVESVIDNIRSEISELKIMQAVTSDRVCNLRTGYDNLQSKIDAIHEKVVGVRAGSKAKAVAKSGSPGFANKIVLVAITAIITSLTSIALTHLMTAESAPAPIVISAPRGK